MNIVRNKLFEDPDGYVDTDHDNDYTEWDDVNMLPVVFGWVGMDLLWNDEIINRSGHERSDGVDPHYFGNKNERGLTHHELASINGDSNIGRNDFSAPGRLWRKSKVISFWDYPNEEEMPGILKELGDAVGEKIYGNPEWRIEIKDQETHRYKLVSITRYNGSEKLSAQELAKEHAKSPLLRKPNISGPGKMHSKTPKPLAWKQAMQAESLITENPDSIDYDRDKNSVSFSSPGAYAFGIFNDKALISDEKATHGTLYSKLTYDERFDIGGPAEIRQYLKYTGRFWLEQKVMSFWLYPLTKKLFFDILKLIQDAAMKDGIAFLPFDEDWQVEVIVERDANNMKIYKMVSVKDFIGSADNNEEELAVQHVASPMDKLTRPDKSGFVKLANKKHKPLAWKQAMMKSESLVTESPDSVYGKHPKFDYFTQITNAMIANSYAFGFYDNNCYISEDAGTHGNIAREYDLYAAGKDARSIFKLPGRIWIGENIISFWKYPKTKAELKNVVDEISVKFNEKYNKDLDIWNIPGFRIDINDLSKEDYADLGDSPSGAWTIHTEESSKLIPLQDYTGSIDASPEELKKKHTDSPMKKSNGSDNADYFRVSDKKHKPLAWKQAMMKSESLQEALNEKLLVGEPLSIEELRDILNKKVLNFEFIKLDGEVRPAKGTTMMKYIPDEEHPTGNHPSSDKVAAFYDLSKSAWRSVSNRSSEVVLISDPETGKPKVRVSDKQPKEDKPIKPYVPKEPDTSDKPLEPKAEVPEPIQTVRPKELPVTPPREEMPEPEADIDMAPLDIKNPNLSADDVIPGDIKIGKEEIEPEEEPLDKEDVMFPTDVDTSTQEIPTNTDLDTRTQEDETDENTLNQEDITFPETFPNEEDQV